MAERGGGGWKRHVLRQLQRRDRAQKARFRDLVQAYNKLLEKSCLLSTYKLQADSLDLQMGLSARSALEPVDSAGGEVLDSAQVLERLKRNYEGHIGQLQRINVELTCEMIERNTLLEAKETALVEQRGRLASVSEQHSNLEAVHRQLKDQVEELTHKNSAVKADYDTLREHYRHQEMEFRRAAERELELLRSVMRMKVEAAEHRNEKNERVKQARLSRELKKATRRPVGIEIEAGEGKAEEQKMSGGAVPERESREKLWRRPFRSASATSMTLTRYVDAFKGLFDFRMKRGNSVSSSSVDHYCCLPSCVAACLPSTVSDAKAAHLSEINAIKFSPNSGMVATGGADRLIKLWSVAGGDQFVNMETVAGALFQRFEKRVAGLQDLARLNNFYPQLLQAGCLGHSRALYLISTLHRTGLGLPLDSTKALKFGLLSAQADDRLSGMQLGHKHHLGVDGLPVDHDLSYAYYANVAAQTIADRELSREGQDGLVSRYMQVSCPWRYYNLSTFSEQPAAYALLRMGDLFYGRHPRKERRDVQAAVQMYTAAALQQEPQGLYNLGLLVEEGVSIPKAALQKLGLSSSAPADPYTLLVELYGRCRDHQEEHSFVPCSLALFSVHLKYIWMFHGSIVKFSGVAVVAVMTGLGLLTVLRRLQSRNPVLPDSV